MYEILGGRWNIVMISKGSATYCVARKNGRSIDLESAINCVNQMSGTTVSFAVYVRMYSQHNNRIARIQYSTYQMERGIRR